jgi:hypothetical protein
MPAPSNDRSMPILHNGTARQLVFLEAGQNIARLVVDNTFYSQGESFRAEWDGVLVALDAAPIVLDVLEFEGQRMVVMDVDRESLRLNETDAPREIIRLRVIQSGEEEIED